MVSDSTLDTDVFDAVRSILVAQAPFITNSTTSATTAASINAVYNDKNVSKPQVVINPINVSEDSWKFGSSQGKKLISVNIDCYADNTLGVDQLFSQVNQALKSTTISGIELVGVVSDYGFSAIGSQKFHVKSGTFAYDRE